MTMTSTLPGVSSPQPLNLSYRLPNHPSYPNHKPIPISNQATSPGITAIPSAHSQAIHLLLLILRRKHIPHPAPDAPKP